MMMFPNASKGYMPFCPSYQERKKAQERRTRHKSNEDKKRRSLNCEYRKSHSTPTLAHYKMDKTDLKFMSVPNLDLSRLNELIDDDKSKSDSSVLKSFLGLFKKQKNDKALPDSTSENYKPSDNEKENHSRMMKPRLESIREEDENLEGSNNSVVSSDSSSSSSTKSNAKPTTSNSLSASKPIASARRQRTAMTALGTSPTSEAPVKKHASQLHEEELRMSTSSLISQEDSIQYHSDCSTSSSSIEKQG